MGKYVFKLPDVGEGTAEAEIVAWHVKVGDTVHEDQHIVDVMTDKATVEMSSPVTGKILALHGEPGAMAPVGAPLVELEVEGAGNEATVQRNGAAKPAAPAPAPKAEEKKAAPAPAPRPAAEPVKIEPAAPVAPRVFGDKPLASPAVRQRAEELGVKLQFVDGSGPGGASPTLTSTVSSRGAGRRPAARVVGLSVAKASTRSRSSACAARLPRRCRTPRGASLTSPMSRKST